MAKTPMTTRGAELLRVELHRLKTVDRPNVIAAIADSRSIRTTALAQRVTYYTTIAGARAACTGMTSRAALEPYRLQELHAKLH